MAPLPDQYRPRREGRTIPLVALEQLRLRIRTRHDSCRTECCDVDWARRFLAYLVGQQAGPELDVRPDALRSFLTHLAVRLRVSASTQKQALGAILFLCREVLGLAPEALALTPRAKLGQRLPVVLSIPETAALLAAMRGSPHLMAGLIDVGGLRVSECCGLRVKDIDLDQGLVFVRGGKGNKDRSTLLAEARPASPGACSAQRSRVSAASSAAGTPRRSSRRATSFVLSWPIEWLML